MYDFKGTEERILDFWQKHGIFEKSLELRKKGKRFVFFEGPPTANGRPGIHHFLGRAFKDLFCRYKAMRGFFVLRRAGWDTHGLPVEIEVEKELGFKNKKDIENYGIGKFNKKAKESVWKYKTEWEEMTRKMGFWLDLSKPYITYENKYIESVWAVIKKIWDRDLLYLAHKVLPFCARCGTSLSSHEVAQGYKKVTERSVYIKFKVKNYKVFDLRPNTYILAWTTTPWTLPGNVALAMGAEIEYIVARKYSENFILAKELASKVLGSEYEVVKELSGKDLVGIEYEPLFDIEKLKSATSYKVYSADFVSTVDGTGVVHTAVMYGEDDYVLGTKLGLPKVHTVNEQGKFIHVGQEFDGLYVKDKKTEEKIIGYLDAKNLLFKTQDYEHDYPFCWRCDSPLLYYAKNSWFIKISAIREQLLKNNDKVNWVPAHIKEGRFGQRLKEGKDWAFSRERYWGTPLPIWECVKCGGHSLLGSIKDIEKSSVGRNNKYYILRHSHTTRDEKGKMIISSDLKLDKYHLTSEGKKHINKVAETIKNKYDIDIMYSSPFIRTMETAGIVAKTLHLKINEDERLGEISHGGCDGKPHKDCPAGGDMRRTFNDKPHELGETWNDVRARLIDFINDAESKYSGKNILIVSHGDPLFLLYTIGLGLEEEEVLKNRQTLLYPGLGEFKEIEWKSIPRNEHGELDLHRPFIDKISVKCYKCGALMKKIPDLIDVWFDSGAMPYAQWHWPFENKAIFKQQFPADFISEAIDQTRGWFYTLLAIATLLDEGAPYKNILCYSHVLDEKGKKMSKSKGNVVSPFEVMNKVGADTARWYFYTLNSPGEYKMFSFKDVEGKLKGFISTIQNCLRFYELYSLQDTTKELNLKNLSELDKWAISRLHRTIGDVSAKLDAYDPMTASRLIEKFVVEDLSNWWLRRSRKRKEAFGLLRYLLLEVAKISAPFVPFMAEDIYQRLHRGVASGTLSIHLYDWPVLNKKLIDEKLETEMEEIRSIATMGLAQRKDKQLKVRQPLRSASIKRAKEFSQDLEELIKDELNVKGVLYDKAQQEALEFDTKLDQSLINEGYARELIRQLQDMRKEAKYNMDEKIYGQWHSDDGEVSSALVEWSGEIKKEALLHEFISGPPSAGHSLQRGEVRTDSKKYDIEKEFDIVPGRKVWIGVRK